MSLLHVQCSTDNTTNTVKPFIRVTTQNEKSLWSLMGSGCL